MKIVLILVVTIAVVATTAALERRRVDEHEGNELQDLSVDDGRDKRHLLRTSSNLHASRISWNGSGKKLGVRQMTHNTVNTRYGGLQRGRPLLGLGSGLSHTTNRKVFGAGIKGPLGRMAIYGASYKRGLGLTNGK